MPGEAEGTDMTTMDELRDEIAVLRAEIRELRAAKERDREPRAPADPAASGSPGPAEPRASRRQLLRVAAAGLGGAGLAHLAGASPASAEAEANGDLLVLGNAGGQSCSQSTGVAVLGASAPYGLAFTDNGVNSLPLPAAVVGHARGFFTRNWSTGVLGIAEEDGFYGVAGFSIRCGVYGRGTGPADNGWPGVLGEGQGDGVRGSGAVGVRGSGSEAGVVGESRGVAAPALRAGGASGLLTLSEAQVAPPASGTYRRGDLLSDRNGTGVWVCVAGGAPGSWRKVAGAASAGAFHPLDGTRAYDSRSSGGALAAGQTRTITIPSGIVAPGATALVYVLTVLNTVGSGNLVAFPAARTSRPNVFSISWFGAGQQHSTTLVTALNAQRQLKVSAGAGSTQFVIDVTGYYR